MKKTIIALSIMVLTLVLLAVAKTNAEKPAEKNRAIKIERATPENPVVYLGKNFDKKSGQEVEGYAIVHFARNDNKPAKPNKPGGATCYGYIAKGAKWRSVEPWVLDSTYTGGLDVNYLLANLSGDIAKWEDATDGTVGNSAGVNVLGDGSLSGAVAAGTLNGQNEVTFAPIQNQGVIAVTYLWGVWGGAAANRQIVEWDQVYNTAYAWSDSGAAGQMDFENIATHELGHAFGMDDLYTSACNQETMYGYADYAETNKRDLNSGDITGINLLY